MMSVAHIAADHATTTCWDSAPNLRMEDGMRTAADPVPSNVVFRSEYGDGTKIVAIFSPRTASTSPATRADATSPRLPIPMAAR